MSALKLIFGHVREQGWGRFFWQRLIASSLLLFVFGAMNSASGFMFVDGRIINETPKVIPLFLKNIAIPKNTSEHNPIITIFGFPKQHSIYLVAAKLCLISDLRIYDYISRYHVCSRRHILPANLLGKDFTDKI